MFYSLLAIRLIISMSSSPQSQSLACNQITWHFILHVCSNFVCIKQSPGVNRGLEEELSCLGFNKFSRLLESKSSPVGKIKSQSTCVGVQGVPSVTQILTLKPCNEAILLNDLKEVFLFRCFGQDRIVI